MSIVKEVLDKWSLMLDDEKAIRDFRGEMLGLLGDVILDTRLQEEVSNAIDEHDHKYGEPNDPL